MTFLNPLALLALAAAAIPILVHLFNFRRPRKVDFSSLVFLRELERSAMQRVRIRQWLLLILRTLAIACLVMAFSRPALVGGIATFLAGDGPRATAIVLDNALSMTVSERQGERLRIAREAAVALTAEADQQDDFFVVTTSGEAEPSPGPLRRGGVGEAVARIRPGPQTRTLDQSIALATSLLQQSDHDLREVVVLSDLKRSTLVDTTVIDMADVDQVTVIGVGSRIPANLSIDRAEVVSRVVDEGAPARIDGRIRNHGPEARTGIGVSVHLENERVAETVVDVPADGAVDVSFEVVPRSRGWLRGRLVVDDASFEPDNERHFVLFVPERRRVAIVRGGGASSRYVELALSPDLTEDRVVFEREVVPQSALAGLSLAAFDAVLMIGVDRLSAAEATALTRYVEDGGGLLMTPGRSASPESLNALLEGLGAGRVETLAGSPGGASIGSISMIETAHPLFEGVFEGREAVRAEQPDVFATLRYAAGGASEQTLMRLSNGWPFLQEVRHGSGVAFLMTSAPDPSWTELAVRGLFVPLIYRTTFYLSAATTAAQELLAGAASTLAVRSPRGGDDVRIILPDGTEVLPEQRSVLGMTRIVLGEDLLSDVGWLEVRDQTGEQLLHRVAVNLAPRESEPALVPPAEASGLLGDRLGRQVVNVDGPIDRSEAFAGLRAARRGVEIWNVFLLLALGFLVAETLVSKRWKAENVL